MSVYANANESLLQRIWTQKQAIVTKSDSRDNTNVNLDNAHMDFTSRVITALKDFYGVKNRSLKARLHFILE